MADLVCSCPRYIQLWKMVVDERTRKTREKTREGRVHYRKQEELHRPYHELQAAKSQMTIDSQEEGGRDEGSSSSRNEEEKRGI